MDRSSRIALTGHRATAIAVMAIVAMSLAACGNKGPLFMPQKPISVDPPVATPADEKPTATGPQEERDATSDPTDTDGPDDGND
ncbi:MAG: lipoprotein [Xanthomonadaceae bacterium]|jgi:predicted small lipoprotein YifL|nr:lipoprotein [Xanthomonadaceae bacterium]